MQREDVWFNSGGDRIGAWRPDRTTTATRRCWSWRTDWATCAPCAWTHAERFAAAGYACLVFDYGNFGDSKGSPRQLLDIRMQLQDWTVAAAFARTLPGIDPQRIGLWGTSFSGGHVIATAALVPGIAAVVSQCPFTDSVASLAAANPLVSARLTALATRDIIASRFGANPVMVKTAGYPGEVAFDDRPRRLFRLSQTGARRCGAAQRGGGANRREAAALPAGSARGQGALPNPVLHLRK